jgi:LDH2 family malate/lactate/ureidoglycolate dehydrogenase
LDNAIVLVQADKLKRYCSSLFENGGMPKQDADVVADTLVEADLIGVESHGVSRVVSYLKKLRRGGVNPNLKLETIRDELGTGVYDAGNSMGAVAAKKVMDIAIEKAKKTGIAFVTVINSSHYGIAGYYAKLALPHDMIGFSATNSVSQMAPWGGRKPFFGTNPFAMAIPAGTQLPIIADMATSVVARGKIMLSAKMKEPIPMGWALTKDGEDTCDAQAALIGSVLPFAGPKGYAIATLIEVITGILSGSVFGPQITGMAIADRPSRTSHCFMAIDVASFGPVRDFKSNIDKMILEIKGNPKAKDVEEIFLPGEIEQKKKMQRLTTGIPVLGVILEELKQEGETFGISHMFI